MNPNESTESRERAYNRAVGKYLLDQLRTAPPPALANPRHPEKAAGAVASIESVLLKMTEGVSLEAALGAREKNTPALSTATTLDRDDIRELREMEAASVALNQDIVDHFRRGRERALGGAADRAATEAQLDEIVAHATRALAHATEALAEYDRMLAAPAGTRWTTVRKAG